MNAHHLNARSRINGCSALVYGRLHNPSQPREGCQLHMGPGLLLLMRAHMSLLALSTVPGMRDGVALISGRCLCDAEWQVVALLADELHKAQLAVSCTVCGCRWSTASQPTWCVMTSDEPVIFWLDFLQFMHHALPASRCASPTRWSRKQKDHTACVCGLPRRQHLPHARGDFAKLPIFCRHSS